ncbi:MAG: fibronectin type III domain-containing protein [Candidatus Nanopelagicales bacterium]|nr:fibronectin type III domain-containing protein [Candidatus Nanopelagicales bacterium]
MPSTDQNFDGISNVNSVLPPDTNGDVGPDHYVQIVNLSFAVYSKTGTLLGGPWSNNALWTGFSVSDCADYNNGDPIVNYDQAADRWVISQFAVDGSTMYECLAVSTGSDPLGTYELYAFDYGTDFPDYPKVGVWPDGYYVTYNMFDAAGTTFLGVKTCALERAKMLAGLAATQQCFDSPTEWSLLPSDLDGSTPPPDGSPNFVLGEHWSDNDKLTMYKFSVDWDTPGNTTFEGPTEIVVDPFTWACVSVTRGRCIPQPGTSVKLESLGGKTMYRLAYRNFGTHESLVVNHTVPMDGDPGLTTQTGVGWYEIRDPDAVTPTVYQDGVFSPDSTNYRWMGSIAMDGDGNIALGYSKSNGTTTYPSIYYAGRLDGDPLDTLPQTEVAIIDGTGSQTHSAARWGDYSAMQVDPEDDCTFWYTNEYLATTGSAPWRTRIGSFKFPSCDPLDPALTPTFDAPTSTADGFTAQVSNYDADYTWGASATSGAAAINGTGLVTVTGLAPGASSTATITTNRTGYTEGTADVTGTASTGAALTPTFDAPTSTANGFTAQVSNYDADYTWGASATSGAAAINGTGLVTVTGLAPGASSTATITTNRTGYAEGTADVEGTALAAGLTPTFDAPTSTADGFTVQVSNYDADYTWGASATSGAAAINGTGLVTVTGLAPGASSTATITTNRTGYAEGTADVTGTATPGPPGAPTGVRGVPGDKKATVSWSAPASTGGSAITGYRVQRRTGSGAWSTVVGDTGTTARSRVVTGLTNGTSYSFRVAAINAVGVGSYSSASSSVTPRGKPGKPGKPKVTPKRHGKAHIHWVRSAANGATVTYQIWKATKKGNWGRKIATTSGHKWTGRVPGAKKRAKLGKPLFFLIRPHNSAGYGTESKQTKAWMK